MSKVMAYWRRKREPTLATGNEPPDTDYRNRFPLAFYRAGYHRTISCENPHWGWNVDAAIALGVVSKLIGLGIKGWQALDDRDFDKDDVEALRALLDTGASFSAMHKSADPSAGALHLALVTRAFGRAVGRHQMLHGTVTLTEGLRRRVNRAEREREREIALRIKFAVLHLHELGNDPVAEVERISALIGDPIGTPYYRALWEAFSDPRLVIEDAGETPPLVMSETARREFERYFLVAYLESLAGVGPLIDRYLVGLARYRVVLVRDLLLRELATWRGRHVFGNVPRERWDDEEAIQFLPLERLYVEPTGTLERDDRRETSEQLLAAIERLAASRDPRIVVVMADFGTGKSLSARMLACRLAERYLTSSARSFDTPLPIYVRCALDFPSDTVDPETTVRRAWKRQADSIGVSVDEQDDSFAWPSPGQRVVCMLDGLDEVTLGERPLQALLEKLRGKTTRNHRFVIFSRPGALRAEQKFSANIAIVRIQPFSEDQIEEWLKRWNALHSDHQPIGLQDLAHRGLEVIAQTPILLFMIAFTWDKKTTRTYAQSTAAIYEDFLYQVAYGKARVDPERHGPVADASNSLLTALNDAHVLPPGALPADAMLWLMGRVAWEAHMLEQRPTPQALTRRDLENLLCDGEAPIPREASDAICIGVILALQADLRGANHTILFGHKSFREFLVGRHWATSLRRLTGSSYSGDPGVTMLLMGGRLLDHQHNAFDYLMQLINADKDIDSVSPLGWFEAERKQLVRWAQTTFSDERQEFGERARPSKRVNAVLRYDRRAELREAALAIGSMTRGSTGMEANDPLALRSMLAWFWLMGETAIVIAPHGKLAKVNLIGAALPQADLHSANLECANLRGTDLSRGNLVSAKLVEADLSRADLSRANLKGADLCRANLSWAILSGANLIEADLSGAALVGTNLIEANLIEADLIGANLSAANLSAANLCQANLTGANLVGANFIGAKFDQHTVWPSGFDAVVATVGASGSADVT